MRTEDRVATLQLLEKTFGPVVSRGQLMDFYAKKNNNGILPRWLMSEPAFKAGRGLYSTTGDVSNIGKLDPTKPFPKYRSPKAKVVASAPSEEYELPQSEVEVNNAQVIMLDERKHDMMPAPVKGPAKVQSGDADLAKGALVPPMDPTFVPFGVYDDIRRVIASGVFYPVFITGASGNGKTLSVEQACAQLRREFIRVQITPETDEDDLIGGFRLINGETVWFDGPVTIAQRRGAILLLDEVDYGTGKISCLQNVLEGKGIFLKKINKFVPVTPGFNVFATANTKGRGSEESGGRYINTQIMNEAFLERFADTAEQLWPSAKIETKILSKKMAALGMEEEPILIENLVKWADVTRKSFENQVSEDCIATRRLVHIISSYHIYGSAEKAIKKCLARFSREDSEAFFELYKKIATVMTDPVNQYNTSVAPKTFGAAFWNGEPAINDAFTNPDIQSICRNSIVDLDAADRTAMTLGGLMGNTVLQRDQLKKAQFAYNAALQSANSAEEDKTEAHLIDIAVQILQNVNMLREFSRHV